MLRLASVLLLAVSFAIADPQQGYGYLPPVTSFNPVQRCDPVTSTVYRTSLRQSVVPTTAYDVSTQYATTTIYSQRLVPTTQYRTQYQTRIQYSTSYVQRESQVVRQQVVTQTQRARPVIQSRYITTVRIVPQVSYYTQTQVRTQVVPVERTSISYRTQYVDQVRYVTVPVQRTSVVTLPGQDILRTSYYIQRQSSVIPQRERDQTFYRTSTNVVNRVQTQTVPSPPVVSTRYIQSQRIIPTTIVSTQDQTNYVSRTQIVTQTRYQTRTQYQTQYIPQEVVVTRDLPREVLRTEYQTQVVPTTIYQTRYETRLRPGPDVYRTQTQYYTSVVSVPGQDRVVSSEIVTTIPRQQVVYRTEIVQRPVTVTRTVEVPCQQGGYRYPEPQIPFKF